MTVYSSIFVENFLEIKQISIILNLSEILKYLAGFTLGIYMYISYFFYTLLENIELMTKQCSSVVYWPCVLQRCHQRYTYDTQSLTLVG